MPRHARPGPLPRPADLGCCPLASLQCSSAARRRLAPRREPDEAQQALLGPRACLAGSMNGQTSRTLGIQRLGPWRCPRPLRHTPLNRPLATLGPVGTLPVVCAAFLLTGWLAFSWKQHATVSLHAPCQRDIGPRSNKPTCHSIHRKLHSYIVRLHEPRELRVQVRRRRRRALPPSALPALRSATASRSARQFQWMGR